MSLFDIFLVTSLIINSIIGLVTKNYFAACGWACAIMLLMSKMEDK